MDHLYQITKKDIPAVATVLSEAFRNYILYVPVIQDEEKRVAFLYELYSLLCKVTLKHGKMYATSSKIEGVVLYVDEKEYNTSFAKIIMCGALFNVVKMLWIAKFAGVKRFFRFSDVLDSTHKSFDVENNMYIQAIAVKPEYQGQKLARKLIHAVLEDCKLEQKSCYLETGDPKNVIIYKHYGFKLLEEYSKTANGRRVYFLQF